MLLVQQFRSVRGGLSRGDVASAAAALAPQVGITDFRAGLLPQDKVEAVRKLEAGGAKVMLVGDP